MLTEQEVIFLTDYQQGKVSKEELFKQYKNLIRFFTGKYLNVEDQEDCYQDCSIALFEIANKYDVTRNVKFSSFLWSQLHGIITNYQRRRNRNSNRYKSLESMIEEIDFDIPELSKQIENFKYDLSIAISSLNEKEKLVIYLHFFREMNIRDIEKATSISFSTIRRIEKKALFKIKTILYKE